MCGVGSTGRNGIVPPGVWSGRQGADSWYPSGGMCIKISNMFSRKCWLYTWVQGYHRRMRLLNWKFKYFPLFLFFLEEKKFLLAITSAYTVIQFMGLHHLHQSCSSSQGWNIWIFHSPRYTKRKSLFSLFFSPTSKYIVGYRQSFFFFPPIFGKKFEQLFISLFHNQVVCLLLLCLVVVKGRPIKIGSYYYNHYLSEAMEKRI